MLRLRHITALSWAVLFITFLFPLWLVTPEGGQTGESAPTLPIDRTVTVSSARDKGRKVLLLGADGAVTETNMADYLWSVVAAEMPASFEPEALRAQACAARTYTLRLQNAGGKHENADVCTDSACCQAWIDPAEAALKWGLSAQVYAQKITDAVSATDGLGIVYGGEPIQAVFFSSAPGKTCDAQAVWGADVAYLQSVDSPEGDEVPNYRTTVTLTASEVRAALLALCPGADLSGDPAGWLTGVEREDSGAVASLLVGGVSATGNAVRGALGLRSPAFTVSVEGDTFTFDVTGYGHGVGMSQYGANEMARQGSDCRTILEWYYTGASVEEIY